jgi:precorrin-6Y C5,15-methyltransferase (decarboxylating)
MNAPWLTLIGLGEDGSFSTAAQTALDAADIVYGSARHFDLVPGIFGEKRLWPSPFSKVFEDLAALKGRSVAVLATGDPQWYGIGSSLGRHFPSTEMTVFPAPSAFQLAAARLGWAVQECECLSVHGRPVDRLRCHLYPGARLLVLTSNGHAPRDVAKLLQDEGYGASRMTVLEHLGGEKERIVSGIAKEWSKDVADFHTLGIEAVASPAPPLTHVFQAFQMRPSVTMAR